MLGRRGVAKGRAIRGNGDGHEERRGRGTAARTSVLEERGTLASGFSLGLLERVNSNNSNIEVGQLLKNYSIANNRVGGET